MRLEIFALCAAILGLWGQHLGKRHGDGRPFCGRGLFLRLGLSALLVLLLVLPRISQYGPACSSSEGKNGMLLILAFEGVEAGTLGMLAFYMAIQQGELSRGVPLAFTPPFWGFLLGVLRHGEKGTALKVAGWRPCFWALPSSTFNILV